MERFVNTVGLKKIERWFRGWRLKVYQAMYYESGWPPLHVAVTSGCFDCAVLLVETGADLGGYTDLVMREYKRLRRQVYCRTV